MKKNRSLLTHAANTDDHLGESRPNVSLYWSLLGDQYEALDPRVRAAHEAPLVATGVLDVVHGSHRLTRLLVALMKLPRAGERLPVDLQVTLDERTRVASRPV